MSSQVDKVLGIYKTLSSIPSLSSARIISTKNLVRVSSVWSQKNLELKSHKNFVREFGFTTDLQPVFQSFPRDVTSELLVALSNDEKYKAVLRDTSVDGKSKQFIEIWNENHIINFFDLPSFDVHGDVYTVAIFSAFEWSHDNKKLLYVAEKKLRKSEPFFKSEPKSKEKSKKDEDEQPSKGTEYIYKPDWGEQLVGKHKSVVVILNLEEETIVPITSIPEDLFPAQVSWIPNSQDIVGIAYKLKPRYPGLYACTNRETYVFRLRGSEFQKLTAESLFCTQPRVSPNGKHLIWLERDISNPHNQAHRLMCLNLDDNEKPYKLVDTIKTYVEIANGKKFYGIYSSSLPQRCWSEDSKYIFFSTVQRSSLKSYVLNLDTKEINEIVTSNGESLHVRDVKDNYLVFSKSSLIQPPYLVITKFDSTLPNIGNLNLIECSSPNVIIKDKNLMYEHNEYVYETDEPVKDFNFTYFGCKNGPDKSVPLIAVAHGGPNAAYANLYYQHYAFYALLGFGILQINFRGSTGMGSDNVDYLVGKIGSVDVRDCITAINSTTNKYPWIDPERINVYGGSHGGFLAAHLSGQYPDKFKSAVLLNPVIDISAMFTVTDIPDWCWAQCGFPIKDLSQKQNLTGRIEVMQKMLEHSPILHVDKVKTPTFLSLGTKDLRVPMSQGMLWYNKLKENNVETKLFVYEDNHSLFKDEVETDHDINSALWLMEHNGI